MSEDWFARRTHRWQDWSLEDLMQAKAGTGVSLVVPARNEGATVGDVVTRVRERLVDTVGLLDEIVVIDSDSTDDTYAVATDAGAVVHRASEIRPDLGWMPGKGEAMWKSLFVTSGDVLVFMDADLLDWDSHFVPGLLGPLLTTPEVALVKGFYERPMLETAAQAPASAAYEGGRVTELVARPLIALLFPELAGLVQPLAGEWAVRRSLFESLHVPTGYAVELAALIDTARGPGLDAIAQVDLGRRAHRHQALQDLGAMATQIIAAAQRRAGAHGHNTVLLQQFGHARGDDGAIAPLVRDVGTGERPPAGALPGGTGSRGAGSRPGRVPGDAPERALGHTTGGSASGSGATA
ncbi:glucosyl-3-phosphoglycerate synthase [Nocardioides pacificus]